MQTRFTPNWKRHEEAIFKGDAKTQEEASDKFLQEREHELATDPQAKRWEEGRKKDIAKQKPDFVKKRLQKERQELDKFQVGMRQFGSTDRKLMPAAGYILVVPEVREIKTESGIILPQEASANMTNKGIVVEVGAEGVTNDGRVVEKPCEKDDLILFKKGAGVEMEIQGEKCRFMQFSDVLGQFIKQRE